MGSCIKAIARPVHAWDRLVTPVFLESYDPGKMGDVDVYLSRTEGNAYHKMGRYCGQAAVTGHAITALSPTAGVGMWDESDQFDVFFDTAEPPVSRSHADVLSHDANILAVSVSGGGYEIIAFRDVTSLTETNEYRLTGLLRGLRGTSVNIASHDIGDEILLLDPNRVMLLEWPIDQVGFGADLRTYLLKAIRPNDRDVDSALGEATAFEVTPTRESFRPRTVANLRGHFRSDNNDLVVRWDYVSREPGTRILGAAAPRWLEGKDGPSDTYEFTVILQDSSTPPVTKIVGRNVSLADMRGTYSGGEPSAGCWTYTGSQQTTDGATKPYALAVFTNSELYDKNVPVASITVGETAGGGGAGALWEQDYTPQAANEVHQIVLNFKPGEYEKAPVIASYVLPYERHPDGSVKRITYYHEPTSTATQTISSNDAVSDPGGTLPAIPTLKITADTNEEHDVDLDTANWTDYNFGRLALRIYEGRPPGTDAFGDVIVADFAVYVALTYWDQVLEREEILIKFHIPDGTNSGRTGADHGYPLSEVKYKGTNIMTSFVSDIGTNNSGLVECQFAMWYRSDSIRYSTTASTDLAGSTIGSFGIDPTLATGGTSTTLDSDKTTYEAGPWYKEYGHNLVGNSSGVHKDMGVCYLDAMDAIVDNDESALTAMHVLGGDWLTRRIWINTADGKAIPTGRENWPSSWVTKFMATEEGSGRSTPSVMLDGKTVNLPPSYTTKTAEAGSHASANLIWAIVAAVPTPLYLHLIRQRTEMMFLYTGHRYLFGGATFGGENRQYARKTREFMAMLPYADDQLRGRILNVLHGPNLSNGQFTGLQWIQLDWWKANGYEIWSTHSGNEPWHDFAPWQVCMHFGSIWAGHVSGYPQLVLGSDEVNTCEQVMQWIVDHCTRYIGFGGTLNWEMGYHTIVSDNKARTISDIGNVSPTVVTTTGNHGFKSGDITNIEAAVDPIVTCSANHGIPFETENGRDLEILEIRGVDGDMATTGINAQWRITLKAHDNRTELPKNQFRVIGIDTTGDTYSDSGNDARFGYIIVIAEATSGGGTVAHSTAASGYTGGKPTPHHMIKVTGDTTFELEDADTVGEGYDANSGICHSPYTEWTGGDTWKQGMQGLEWLRTGGSTRADDIIDFVEANHATPWRWIPKRP